MEDLERQRLELEKSNFFTDETKKLLDLKFDERNDK